MKITDDEKYVRPNKTLTDKCQTKSKIREQLEGYEEIEDISSVDLKCKIRYITLKKDNKKNEWFEKFLFGGSLIKKCANYIVLGNGKISWCVQKKIENEKDNVSYKTRFFKEITSSDILQQNLEKTQEVVLQQNMEIEKLKKVVKSIKKNLSNK